MAAVKPGYDHTQRGGMWLVFGVFVLIAAGAAAVADEEQARVAITILVGVFAVLSMSFATLTVRDRGEHLDVRFGPLPLFGTKVRYDAIRAVRPARSRLVDGWGVHWIPGRGWTFNVWGFDCVEVTTSKGLVRIGTDDKAGLAAFLAQRAGVELAAG